MKKNCFHAAWLGTLMVLATSAGAATAQENLPTRGPDYFADAAQLSQTLGSAHAIRVRCKGREDQYWRNYMREMINYEAPAKGNLRGSLVEAFNDAFSRVSAQFQSCDRRAVEAEARYAQQGRAIANRMATFYFAKRNRRSTEE
jgi:uncharacterized protein (TIGR02301 family)